MTVQMTLDEKLLKKVDDLAHKLRTSRSALTREALNETLKKYQAIDLENKHKAGYLKHPVAKGEFDIFQEDQAWGEV